MERQVRRPLNILLVEGSQENAMELALMLNGDGHAVSRAGTLAEANELCEDGRFDLLIAETRLPDGPACELLADAAPCDGVPGILLATPGEDLCKVSLGFAQHLTKPVRLPALRQAITRATAS